MEQKPHLESPIDPIEEKMKIWDEKMDQMLKPDVYGYVLDEKIRETVVALNLLGINTTQSDQGNHSHSPWIQFEAPIPKNYYQGEADLRYKVLDEKKVSPEVMDENSKHFNRSTQVDILVASRDEIMKSGGKYTPELLKYFEDTQKMVEKAQSLIDEYYSIEKNLQNEGTKVEVSYRYDDPKYPAYLHRLPFLQVSVSEHSKSEEERKIIVAQTQEELLRFTEYLKKKFFENE